MSRNTRGRCREAQRFGVVLGAAAVLASTASGAGAATGVVIPLEPGEVILSAFPVENFGPMDPMTDPNASPTFALVDVQYSGTLTVNLPVELDSAAVEAEIGFDDNNDGNPDKVYSSALAVSDPNHLAITGEGTGSIQITLPTDDNTGSDEAVLFLEPLTTNLSAAFDYYDPVFYDLNFTAAAAAAVTVEPVLVAVSQEPCDISTLTRCAFPTPITAGSTVTLDLTSGSALRELGIADLTGVQVGLVQLDANGDPVGAPTLLTATASGSTANFTVPAGTAAGSYGVVIAQEGSTGAISTVFVEITVVAATTPAAAPTTAVNAGLRSNTGVEMVETGSTGNATVAMGAGLLLLAGAGGIAVARNRRRPAVEGGTCES